MTHDSLHQHLPFSGRCDQETEWEDTDPPAEDEEFEKPRGQSLRQQGQGCQEEARRKGWELGKGRQRQKEPRPVTDPLPPEAEGTAS